MKQSKSKLFSSKLARELSVEEIGKVSGGQDSQMGGTSSDCNGVVTDILVLK